MMHELVVPQAFTRVRIERYDAVGEEIVTFAVAAVKVKSRGTERYKGDTVFLIDRKLAPVVDSAGRCLQGFRGPRVGSEFTGFRDAVESPFQLAGSNVVGADITRCRV